jgi:L-alanine-DL-glutamate epimerase-like enolase superfamily enzyme
MRIDSIQLFRTHVDIEVPSDGGPPPESIVVRIESSGKFGFGEVCLSEAPTDSEEWSAGAFACLRDWLAPALVGQSIDSGQRLQEVLRPFQGNARAKSALDNAWWFLSAVVQDKPLYQLLGGSKDAVPVSHTIGVKNSPEAWLAEVRCAVERCELVTLKFRPGWDRSFRRRRSPSIATDCVPSLSKRCFTAWKISTCGLLNNRCRPTTWSAMPCCNRRCAHRSASIKALRRSIEWNKRSTWAVAGWRGST